MRTLDPVSSSDGVMSLSSWGSFPLPRLSDQESDSSGIIVSIIILLLLSGCRGYLWYEKGTSTLARRTRKCRRGCEDD